MKKFPHYFLSTKLDATQEWQQILRVIDTSKSYRDVKINKKDLEMCVENFEKNILKLHPNELQVNYSHNSHERAAGWIEELRVSGKHLEAKIRWTPNAKQIIEDEEFRFFSAEWSPSWQDVETQEVHQCTLLGAALTNIPFVPGMKAVALSDARGKADGNFLFLNHSLEMDNFKKLLSTLQVKQDVLLCEAQILKSQFSLLPEDDRAEFQSEVEKIEKLAQENDAKATKEKEELSKKLEEANKALELAQKGGSEEVKNLASELKEAQKNASELQKAHDKLALDLRTKDLKEQVTKLSDEGRILPKDIDKTVQMALAQGVQEKQDKFVSFLSEMPVRVDFSEIGSGSAEDADEDAKIAKINKLAEEKFATDKSKTLAEWRMHFTRELS